MNKNIIIIITAIILVSILVTGCLNADANENRILDSLVIDAGVAGSSMQTAKLLVVIDNQESYENNFYLVNSLDTEIPVVDLSENIILAVYMGLQYSGGFTINIDSIEEYEAYIKINVVSKAPGVGCPVDTALTYPYDIKSIQKSEKAIVFSETHTINDCSS